MSNSDKLNFSDELNLIKTILEKHNGDSKKLEKYIESKDIEIKKQNLQ